MKVFIGYEYIIYVYEFEIQIIKCVFHDKYAYDILYLYFHSVHLI